MSNDDAREQILKAIGDHGRWKLRLRAAAINGHTDLPVAEICRDDACAFGRWLQGAGDLVEDDPNLPRVIRLHHDFHAEAGRIAGMIVEGRKAEALGALEADKPLVAISRSLASAMAQWRAHLQAC